MTYRVLVIFTESDQEERYNGNKLFEAIGTYNYFKELFADFAEVLMQKQVKNTWVNIDIKDELH